MDAPANGTAEPKHQWQSHRYVPQRIPEHPPRRRRRTRKTDTSYRPFGIRGQPGSSSLHNVIGLPRRWLRVFSGFLLINEL